MTLCGGKGIRNFAVVAKCAAAKGRSPWFYLLCRAKAMCGKEAFWLT